MGDYGRLWVHSEFSEEDCGREWTPRSRVFLKYHRVERVHFLWESMGDYGTECKFLFPI
jgi:hypothetical protein